MKFQRLLPKPGATEIGDLLESLFLERRAPATRPYTIVNFVASADGRATIGGRSGPLGDDGDRALFHCLRQQVDAVLAGTATLQAERYGPILGKPPISSERRQRRGRRGLSPEPLACIFTRSGAVPADIPLFADPESKIIVFSPPDVDFAGSADLDHAGSAAQVTVVRLDPGELTLTTALRRLRAEHGVRTLLCEGGPTLFGALLAEGLVDELFLTIAPKLAGGGRGPTISTGSELAAPAGLRLEWLLERHGSLYARYSVAPA